MVPGGPVSSPRLSLRVALRVRRRQPLFRRKDRRLAAGPCAPWILPVSCPPLPWPSAWTWRLRSSASRNLRFTSSRSGFASPSPCCAPADSGAACPAACSASAGGASTCSAAAWAASARPAFGWAALALGARCCALSVMESSLAADRPAAGPHRVQQRARLLRADRKLSNADRQARRVLDADVFDVHPGGA